VAVPPAVANRHRHGLNEADEDVAHHALSLLGTHAVPKQRLTSDNRGQRTRVAVPPAVANRHRHGRH
jgi:ABC-type cobalamin/Fe3+-siderophores transport system ATPase subunit